MQQVFKGLRVLDFGRFIAAPWCSAILADLGADVIRVEKREGGEDRWVQSVGPNGASAGYLSNNRNKRSLTLDTTTPEGRAIAAKLVASADVVIANMPDEAMAANGLDYETLKAIKPDIILASATAYGRGGPYSKRVGFDGVGQVMSGAVYRTGAPEQPYRTAVPYVDYSTALSLTIAVMAAIIHRNATGEGQQVEAALLPSALMISNALCIEQAILKKDAGRVGNRGMAIGPSDLFAVGDGWILVQVTGQPMFKRWCRLMEREEWFTDPRFADDEQRAANIAPLNARMSEWCQGKTMEQAMAALGEARVPASPVLSPQQVLDDPHVQAMGYLKPLDYPGLPSPAPVIETPFRMSATPPSIRTRAPTVGEHTDALLADLGYSEADIAALHERAIV
ncbi:CaiB/BaiF CoA transferase family protein [Novosphingobium bradum]|uniref:CaiB/BaiF CoA transferase family protein n=1 Tax=Novosphingobium bradum TaxID=1737444 RepID=A0ABV7IIY7_9SPHN